MSDYHFIINESEFPEDDRFVTMIVGWRVFITRVEGEYFAINDRCPHAASILSTGRMRKSYVTCPLHGARYDVKTGACAGGAYANVRTFPLRIVDGKIEVEVPNEPPGPSEVPVHFDS